MINLSCSPWARSVSGPAPWIKCNILLAEKSSKSPDFIKWQPRCLYLNVAKASQSQRMCVAVADACLHPSHSGLFINPSLNRYSFKWQCPVSNPVNILSWFLLSLSNHLARFADGILNKTLRLSLTTYGLPILLMFPISPVPDTPTGNHCSYTKCSLTSY